MKKSSSLFLTMFFVLALACTAFADYRVTYSGTADVLAPVRNGQDIVWSTSDSHFVSAEVIGYYNDYSGVFTVTEVTATGAEMNFIDGALNTASNVGTAGTGTTAVEYGDGFNHTTVLTLASTDAITVADNAALCDGYLMYTFPAGEVIIKDVSISVAGTLAEDTTATPEFCIGTVAGSAAAATCGADAATVENMFGPSVAADMNGTAEVLTTSTGTGTPLVVATAGAHTAYFNVCDTWADTAGTDLTGDLAGTVVINWQFMQ